MLWVFCGHCSAQSGGGEPLILCQACSRDFGKFSVFNCTECKMMDGNFLIAAGGVSAEFAKAAKYVPRKERRKSDRKSLVKVAWRKGRGKHRG